MYLPDAFRQPDLAAIQNLVSAYPLATLVFATKHGFEANHIPLLYFPSDPGQGKLVGHVSKANSMWRDYEPSTQALAIFHGPDHYISPNWYPSKHEHGRAVPTWNYAAVHMHGTLTIHHDAARLLNAVTLLTDHSEPRVVTEGETPWKVSDAPAEFTTGLLNAIVGIELTITGIEAKWKVSQNRPAEDQDAVASALESRKSDASHQMAKMVRRDR